MFLSAIALALIAGALAGGGLPRLADLRLRWLWLLGLALALRIAAVQLRGADALDPAAGSMAFIGVYVLLFAWLWGNWRVPGLQVAAVGIALNALAIILNRGAMPVWSDAFTAAGFNLGAITNDPFHALLTTDSVSTFIARGGLFGDVVPIPIPLIRDVVSIGDVLLAFGIVWAIVAAMTRPGAPVRAGMQLGTSTGHGAPSDQFSAGVPYAGTGRLDRPGTSAARAGQGRTQSPYLVLARNRNFSLLWTGQLVSFFGDRINQVALYALVAQVGGLELGIVAAATAVPNVLLGSLAGAFVDRWDRRRTMIVSDLIRAGLVLLVPLLMPISIVFAYLIAFLVAVVSLLFRPAKNALLPRIVDEDQLVTANSASTVNETVADLIGYPVAGVLVAALSGLAFAAFVLDAATYVVSAVLLLGMTVPRDTLEASPLRASALWAEMLEGWQFLTRQADLFANTLISTAAQIAVGVEVVCSVLYAERVLDQTSLPPIQIYGLLMAAVGLGSVIGGLVIGQLGSGLHKGPLTILGFVGMGLTFVVVGLVRDPFVAIGLFFVIGAMNMVWLIPTITLFQERTPQRLMGRVVGTRQALVFGVMATAMAVAGWASDVISPATVFIIGGLICAAAGLAGTLVPAMRQAR
jgi:MFS family permease